MSFILTIYGRKMGRASPMLRQQRKIPDPEMPLRRLREKEAIHNNAMEYV
jgi:uncharacterized membrane protein YecN with MAPEG domain